MSNEKPQISVIIPTYDRVNLVGRAIQSVLSQTYQDFEVIIVDDASKDNTEDFIKSFHDKRIRYIRHKENKGGSAARNTGIMLSKGEFLAFLDSDDEWFPEKLEKQMEVFQNTTSNVGVVYTGYYWIGNNMKTYTPPDRITQKDGYIQESLLKENFVTTSAALVKKECFEKLGLFDENFPAFQDWDLFIRFSKYYCFKCIDEPLVTLYYQSASITGNQNARTEAMKLIIEKHLMDFMKNKELLAAHYFSIGKGSYFNRDIYNGINYYMKAIKANPLSFRLLLSIVITLFGRKVHIKTLDIYQKIIKHSLNRRSNFMNIFLVCDIAVDNKDAQNIHITELFNNMCKISDVYLFTPGPKKNDTNLSSIKYIPRLFIPPLGMISYQISLFFYLYYYCRKTKVDAFYVRQSVFSFMPLIISKYFRIPYFVEVNGLIIDEMKMFGKSKLSIAVTKLSEKLGYEHARKIIAVTPGIKKGIIEFYEIPDEKIIVIENGANIELFQPIDQEIAKEESNLENDMNYVCFVGNFAPWQGIEYLIQAAPFIIKECPAARFLIVGDGIMKTEWMQLAKKLGVNNKFIFTGSIPYKQIPLYINSSDLCVAPFIKKRNMKIGLSPLKIYEYMACGKPIVSSLIPNLEFIEQQNIGILVQPENPEELAKAVISLMNDETLRTEMGKNGREFVIKNNSWEAIGQKIFTVCKNAIQFKD